MKFILDFTKGYTPNQIGILIPANSTGRRANSTGDPFARCFSQRSRRPACLMAPSDRRAILTESVSLPVAEILLTGSLPVRGILEAWRITNSSWMGWLLSWWTSFPRAAVDPCVDFRPKRRH